MSEVAPGIHRIEEDLGPRFMAQYLLTGSERTLLVDTGLSQTLDEAIAPYLESIGLGVEAIDELFISHADVDHIGSNRALRERSPRTRICAASSTAAGSSRTRRSWPRTTAGSSPTASRSATRCSRSSRASSAATRRSTSAWAAARRSGSGAASAGRCSRCPGHTLGHIGLWHAGERTAIIIDAVLAAASATAPGSC